MSSWVSYVPSLSRGYHVTSSSGKKSAQKIWFLFILFFLATVIVGRDMKRFVVHEHLLTHYSDFFRAALTGGFKEAVDKVVTLAEDNPQTLDFFVHWLYYQRFPNKAKCDADELTTAWSANDDHGTGITKSTNLILLHVFSDKYNISQLYKETFEGFYHYLQLEGTRLANVTAIAKVFNSLDENAPLYRYLVDLHCCVKWVVWERDTTDRRAWSTGFPWSVLRHYNDIVVNKMLSDCWKLKLCDYHDHKTNAEEEACKKEQKRQKRKREA